VGASPRHTPASRAHSGEGAKSGHSQNRAWRFTGIHRATRSERGKRCTAFVLVARSSSAEQTKPNRGAPPGERGLRRHHVGDKVGPRECRPAVFPTSSQPRLKWGANALQAWPVGHPSFFFRAGSRLPFCQPRPAVRGNRRRPLLLQPKTATQFWCRSRIAGGRCAAIFPSGSQSGVAPGRPA